MLFTLVGKEFGRGKSQTRGDDTLNAAGVCVCDCVCVCTHVNACVAVG